MCILNVLGYIIKVALYAKVYTREGLEMSMSAGHLVT